MFSIIKWDGLAKIGKYKINEKEMITPALFPVVDPFKQEIPIDRLQEDFGFDQVITSAYLMSKRLSDKKLEEFPDVHDYLNFHGIVMMDSGAYQVMLYGDIDLGVMDTLKLQDHVKTDIGVIMDHPIGINVSHDEAEGRIKNTLSNIDLSTPFFENSNVNWTLPLQGGKYGDLMENYLQKVNKKGIIDKFNFYAIGSVVQVMIHQRYDIMVDMIARVRKVIPVDKPLHLFGAGHPAMFALATFLGCDTFDSAAYILMAKDNRYMTVEGTFQLDQLKEFPCYCKICCLYTPQQMLSLKRIERTKLLAQHNLYVSNGEIRRVRNAIRYGRLWDLVQQRASAVPNLAKATRKAVKLVTEGYLKELYRAGVPIFNSTSIRMMRDIDTSKIEIIRMREDAHRVLNEICEEEMVCLAYKMDQSIYNRSSQRLMNFNLNDKTITFFLPPFGFIPALVFDMYPIGQLSHDLEFKAFDFSPFYEQLDILITNGLKKIILFIDNSWPQKIIEMLQSKLEIEIFYCYDPVKEMIKHFSEKT